METTSKNYSNTATLLRLFADGQWHSSINMVESAGYKAQARLHELRKQGVEFETRTPEWDATKRFLEFRMTKTSKEVHIVDGEVHVGDPYAYGRETLTMSFQTPSGAIYREVTRTFEDKIKFQEFAFAIEDLTVPRPTEAPTLGYFGKVKKHLLKFV